MDYEQLSRWFGSLVYPRVPLVCMCALIVFTGKPRREAAVRHQLGGTEVEDFD